MRIFQVLMWALTCSTMYLTRLMLRLTFLAMSESFLPAGFLGGVIIPPSDVALVGDPPADVEALEQAGSVKGGDIVGRARAGI